MKIKAKYCGCWNLKQKMLENLSICGERIELMLPVWMITDAVRFSSIFCFWLTEGSAGKEAANWTQGEGVTQDKGQAQLSEALQSPSTHPHWDLRAPRERGRRNYLGHSRRSPLPPLCGSTSLPHLGRVGSRCRKLQAERLSCELGRVGGLSDSPGAISGQELPQIPPFPWDVSVELCWWVSVISVSLSR